MISRIGEFAAFGTSVSWTIGALIMERSVKRVGVMAVNTLKVAFGSVYLALFSFFLTGQLFPLHAPPAAWLYLGASAFFGFVIGDYFLFHAYELIGSRLAMLLMSISVPLTAVGALFVFGERLGLSSILGIAICVSGIALTVISGKPSADSGDDAGGGASAGSSFAKQSHAARYAKGVAYGLLSGLFMAVATLMTKKGAADIVPVAATQIRIFCAFVGFVAFALVTGKIGEVGRALRNPAGVGSVAAGGIFGPFIGVGLLLFALQNANAGIVSTLSSFSPVLIILPSVVLFRRRVTPGEIAGAVIAVAGLAVLFL
jgi:drug/metabolite transporter (DMT)-like permease